MIQVEKPKKSEYREIENKAIAEIVERLQAMARQAISDNYTISSNKVTQAMINEAQDVLTSLLNATKIEDFNNILLKLFTVIPRKMGNVQDYLLIPAKIFQRLFKKNKIYLM